MKFDDEILTIRLFFQLVFCGLSPFSTGMPKAL
jgi:hypothetical protein